MKPIRRILSLLLCAALLTALFSSCALAEETVYTTVHLNMHRNRSFAKYGVTVQLDGKPVGHVGQGDQLTFGGYLSVGSPHVISLVPDKASVDTHYIVINSVQSGATVHFTVQTHVFHVEVSDVHTANCSAANRY